METEMRRGEGEKKSACEVAINQKGGREGGVEREKERDCVRIVY